MNRRKSWEVRIGAIAVGGANPIAVQSMLNASTADLSANIAQAQALWKAGCDIIRVAVPSVADIALIRALKQAVPLPVVADIQYDWRIAVAAAEAGADKIRINPGNIGDRAKTEKVVLACRAAGVSIRIGVNSGSLEKDILRTYGRPTAEALAESALRNIEALEELDFSEYLVAIKSPDVFTTVEAYRKIAAVTDCPLHLGVTEAGPPRQGLIKSAAAFGALLADGIGDTLRVSLTADPTEEVRAARDILRALGLLQAGPVLVSCPTCGRCKVNLLNTVERVEKVFSNWDKPLKIAVMGCAVNGPGEAADADLGLAAGNGEFLLFRRGESIGKVPEYGAAEALLRAAQELELDQNGKNR